MAIVTQGSLEPPQIPGLEESATHQYRIACAQVLPSEDGITGDGGLGKLQAYAEEAARLGADVVVFPEYFLTGATPDIWRAVRERGQVDSSDPQSPDHFLHLIGKIASQNDIDIVAGTVVELGLHHIPHRSEERTLENDDHHTKLFNTVYYVDRTGTVAGRYTKKRLWHPEREVLSPGRELPHSQPRTFPIKTRQGRTLNASIAVCWDLAFPETFREMLSLPENKEDTDMHGPDVIFAPTCWYATDSGSRGLRWNKNGEAALLDSVCLTRAIESESILAMTNIAGPTFPSNTPTTSLSEADAIGVGRTCICAPFAGCLGRLEHAKESLLLACVDLRVLQDARSVYRQRHDLLQVMKQ